MYNAVRMDQSTLKLLVMNFKGAKIPKDNITFYNSKGFYINRNITSELHKVQCMSPSAKTRI